MKRLNLSGKRARRSSKVMKARDLPRSRLPLARRPNKLPRQRTLRIIPQSKHTQYLLPNYNWNNSRTSRRKKSPKMTSYSSHPSGTRLFHPQRQTARAKNLMRFSNTSLNSTKISGRGNALKWCQKSPFKHSQLEKKSNQRTYNKMIAAHWLQVQAL